MKEKIKEILKEKNNIEKVLKKDHRSFVYVFKYEDKRYVYKEPIEKNTRKWQKFLSFFRGTESKREYLQMIKINSLGINTAKPIFYEKEYLVYEYIEGRKPNYEDIKYILEELKKIHSLGYLHGDSHLDNFIINGEKVYIIDSKFQKNKFGKFGEIFEMMYLEDSLGRKLDYDKGNFYYKCATLFRAYLTYFSKIKNIIRRR